MPNILPLLVPPATDTTTANPTAASSTATLLSPVEPLNAPSSVTDREVNDGAAFAEILKRAKDNEPNGEEKVEVSNVTQEQRSDAESGVDDQIFTLELRRPPSQGSVKASESQQPRELEDLRLPSKRNDLEEGEPEPDGNKSFEPTEARGLIGLSVFYNALPVGMDAVESNAPNADKGMNVGIHAESITRAAIGSEVSNSIANASNQYPNVADSEAESLGQTAATQSQITTELVGFTAEAFDGTDTELLNLQLANAQADRSIASNTIRPLSRELPRGAQANGHFNPASIEPAGDASRQIETEANDWRQLDGLDLQLVREIEVSQSEIDQVVSTSDGELPPSVLSPVPFADARNSESQLGEFAGSLEELDSLSELPVEHSDPANSGLTPSDINVDRYSVNAELEVDHSSEEPEQSELRSSGRDEQNPGLAQLIADSNADQEVEIQIEELFGQPSTLESTMEQIVDSVFDIANEAAAVPQTRREIRLQLEPVELGALEIRVESTDENVTAQIYASELATSEMLNRDKQILTDALLEAGIVADDVEIQYRQPNDGQQGHSEQREHRREQFQYESGSSNQGRKTESDSGVRNMTQNQQSQTGRLDVVV